MFEIITKYDNGCRNRQCKICKPYRNIPVEYYYLTYDLNNELSAEAEAICTWRAMHPFEYGIWFV